MKDEIYLTLVVTTFAALWFVWDLGIKKLLLDAFRERLFRLRAKLFALGMTGEIDFDSDAYRSIETLICGLLRFAHRVTLFGFIMSAIEQVRAKQKKEYVDYHKQIELKISRTPPDVQEKLNAIMRDVTDALTVYMALSSLFFLFTAVVFLVLRGFNFVRDSAKSQVSSVLESEIYYEESHRSRYA